MNHKQRLKQPTVSLALVGVISELSLNNKCVNLPFPSHCSRHRVFHIRGELSPENGSAGRMTGWIGNVGALPPVKHPCISVLRLGPMVRVDFCRAPSMPALGCSNNEEKQGLGCGTSITECPQCNVISSLPLSEFYLSKMFLLLKKISFPKHPRNPLVHFILLIGRDLLSILSCNQIFQKVQ